jgi:AraC-like DNA-binding protein
LNCIFVLAVAEITRKDTARANRLFAEQVAQTVDYSLKSIDQMMLNELGMNEMWSQFFEIKPGVNKYILEGEMSQKLNFVIKAYPLIDSISLIRFTDGKVLTNQGMTDLNAMPDRDFLLGMKETQPGEARFWINPGVAGGVADPKPVFSLMLRYPLLSGELGLAAVHIRHDEIRNLIAGMSRSSMSFVRVYDREGHLMADLGSSVPAGDAGREGVVLSSIRSGYTGWEFQSGLKSGTSANAYSSLSYVWIVLILVVVTAGTGFIVYVTGRNYKPIESLVGTVDLYATSKRQLLKTGGKRDEFTFIASALDNLIRQTNEDLMYKRRHFFQELFEGGRTLTVAEWESETSSLGWSGDCVLLHAGVAEIDRYARFAEEYSERDRSLLRFALSNVAGELGQQHGIDVWPEWISNRRMALLFRYGSDDPAAFDAGLLQTAAKLVEWVRDHLKMTVTVALGSTVRMPSEIPQSYQCANDGLRSKPALGECRVITAFDLADRSETDVFFHLQTVRSMAKSYRLGEEQWEEHLELLMEGMQQGVLYKENLYNMANYIQYQLNREMTELSDEIRGIWENEAAPELQAILDSFETLQDLYGSLKRLLLSYEEKIRHYRHIRANYSTILEVRSFIDAHYANPDMSLTYIGEHFHMKSGYLSRLFKEETGENFVDYLARIRIEKAMALLRETQLPVQDIANQVGYTHYVSFNRVFKKVAGTTPGDYRSHNAV